MRALPLLAFLWSVSAPVLAVANTNAIPEPESLSLLAMAAAAMWLARRRKP